MRPRFFNTISQEPFLKINKMNEVEIDKFISSRKLSFASKKSKLELADHINSRLIEKIKQIIKELVHSDEQIKTNLSSYLSEKLNYNYTYLASLFSKSQGTTIQNYLLTSKIERVKELLLENELSLTGISYKLHYSSVAHLSNQFRKVVGLSPSSFLAAQAEKENSLSQKFDRKIDRKKFNSAFSREMLSSINLN